MSLIIASITVLGIINSESSVYAQTNLTDPTTLPPVQMETVDPVDTEDSNSTSIINEENTGNYLSYQDSDIGFTIDYPSDWEVSDSGLTNYAVVVFAPPGSDWSAQVNVKVYARENGESLKTFGDGRKNDDNLRLSAYYRNSTTLLGGEPAIRVTGTLISTPNYFESLSGEESTTKKILSMVTLLKEKKSFLEVIYYADKSNYDDYLPYVEHMLQSFQLQKTKPIIQED